MNNTDQTQAQSSKVTINTIQRTALVERICINKNYPNDRVIPYDLDNLYPNKVKAIAQRSGTTTGAIETLASFISGEGFQGMDTIVNDNGLTLWGLLRFISVQKATFKGFALHFNYNMFGQISEINPVPFEFVRWGKDQQNFVVHPDWGRKRRHKKDEIEYNIYNPDNVLKEIEEAGSLEAYQGQLLYSIDNKQDIYPLCNFDSVLDDAQLEAEAKIYSLSNIQNDFSLSGFFMYPKFLESDEEVKEVKSDLKGDTGSKNAGGIKVFGANPSEEMKGWKWWQPISRNNIDGLFKEQKQDAKMNIYHRFKQPPVLNGVFEGGVFSRQAYEDAFDYYNSQTETERKDTEKQLTAILDMSIWNVGEIRIIPKSFIKKADGNTID